MSELEDSSSTNTTSTGTSSVAIVLRWAIVSRVIVWALALVADVLVSDYDTSSIVVSRVALYHSPSLLDTLLLRAYRMYTHWDSVYFLRIAEVGYEYEQTHAFFPLLPLAIQLVHRTLLWPLSWLLSTYTSLVLAGVIVSNGAFVIAAVLLYRLSFMVLHDEALALTSALLFCLTPANIHMSAIYSESLYAAFSFGGLLMLESGRSVAATVALACTGGIRSNGSMHAWYFVYPFVQHLWALPAGSKWLRRRNLEWLGVVLARTACLSIPLVCYQAYVYWRFCGGAHVSLAQRAQSPWCEWTIPSSYSYIQSRYWNVGLFRYYTWNNIPNFLIAAPVLGLSVWAIASYLVVSAQRWQRARPHGVAVTQGFYSASVLPYIVHWAALVGVCFTVLHVQVSTRFLAATPPLYWFCASWFVARPSKAEGSDNARATWMQTAIVAYFVGFTIIGTVLFANFYPWT